MNQNKTSINAMRMLGVDMINQAKSGHPGIVLGAAPMMYTLFTEHLAYDPQNPQWFDRDRFIMAAGHGSALLYATLHLAGFEVSMEDLKSFRQWGSNTPGHPEYRHTPGVDATSGPLGQGIAMAAGLAVAESYVGSKFNQEGQSIVDHYTYVLCGDGDLQEGVTQEAISLAGHLGLGKLIVLFDSNDIQLDGPVKWAFSENIKKKFESMNWHYLSVSDGEDVDAINQAIWTAKENESQPTLIEVKTIIGFGSPDAGDSETHGAPIGLEKTKKTRETLGWEYQPFEIPQSVYEDFKKKNEEKGMGKQAQWQKLFQLYQKTYPELAIHMKQMMEGTFNIDYDSVFNHYEPKRSVATRASSGDLIKLLQEKSPLLMGGSADLTKSTKVKGIEGDFSSENPTGRNICFGVREHAMAAIVNGLTLHGLRGFGGGFFIFSDYMRPAMRMAALMGIPALFVFTHDSVAVGEDGPTHEPVEQLAGLRAVPNMTVIRPADAYEVMGAWRAALENHQGPTSIVLTRQNVPTLENSSQNKVSKGGYVISGETNQLDGILIATGSEVALAIEVQKELLVEGWDLRVVSLPSFELFDKQSEDYKEQILPAHVEKRIAIEMGASLGWHKYTGLRGLELTIDRFGASAKGDEVVSNYGFNILEAKDKVLTYIQGR